MCEEAGLKHFHIEFNGANQNLMSDPVTLKYLRKRLRELFWVLSAGPEIALIHCSAGMHRTGTLGYTVLRMVANEPLDPQQAYLALKELREDTWKGVGDWRIELAENEKKHTAI